MEKMKSTYIARVGLILLLVLPLLVSFSNTFLWLWPLLISLLFLTWLLFSFSRESNPGPITKPEPRMLHEEEQPPPIRDVMNVQIAIERSGVLIFRGKLRETAATAYDKLKTAFSGKTVPLVQEDDELGAAILLMPKPIEQATMERPVRVWLHVLLFFLTFLTTTWVGALQQGVNLLSEPSLFPVGLQYSLGLLAILGVHEFGHFFMARYHGMNVTPPYFVPIPFGLGTFGAFIQMRSPSENRKSLFDVAVAGPLAGLLIAIPALYIGLQSSTILPEDTSPQTHGTSVGSSVLLALIAKFSLGSELQVGHVIRLSPLAFAGWLGLFITALNLIPVGQLDGGHIARAMFGNRIGSGISMVTLWAMLFVTIFIWPGLMMWMIILFFIAGGTTPPLNDITPLRYGRLLWGIFSFVILALIILPLPHPLWEVLGINRHFL
jgi:Zn-dependent protease